MAHVTLTDSGPEFVVFAKTMRASRFLSKDPRVIGDNPVGSGWGFKGWVLAEDVSSLAQDLRAAHNTVEGD